MARMEVEVGVKATRFRRGLDELRRMASSWSRGLSNLGSNIGSRGFDMARGAARRLIASTRDVVKEMAALNDQAEKLGEDPEALQALAHAAEQNGAALESYTKALTKANLAAMDATDGNEEAAAMMETLGINAEKFLEANMASQVVGLAEAFQQLSKDGDPTLRFIDLFGERYSDLLVLLRQGPEAVKKTLDSAAIVSKEDLAILAAYDDRMAELKRKAAVGEATVAAKGMGMMGDALNPQKVESGVEARKRVLRKAKVTDPEEEEEKRKALEKLKEREKEVDFQNLVESADAQRKAHLLEGRQNELITRSRELEAAGDTKGAAELRIQAKEMQSEVNAALEAYRAPKPRSTVATSMQEVGGGGNAVTFGNGLEIVTRTQAADIREIKLVLGRLVGASLLESRTDLPAAFEEVK